jgi:FK506-binding nuclear protein
MKITLSILSLLFVVSLAHAEGPDGAAASDADGAMVEKKAEKVTPKKKAKKTAAKKDEPKASDALKPVESKKEKDAAKAEDEKAGKAKKRTDGLVITDLKVGSGMEAKLGSKITVHYKGTLISGKTFDESYGGEPITFDLEEGRLIKGWTEGIPGMKVGGKRKLFVPYPLAYGDQGTPGGPIPPKSDLNFEVELIKVQ